MRFDSIAEMLAWGEEQPWCPSMKDCGQNPVYHAEGDAWTHTRAVCESLPKLDEWGHVTENERQVLMWSALLHDVAKPDTTVTENGVLKSPYHSVKGMPKARKILMELNMDFRMREDIVNLVRYHITPPHLVYDKHPGKKVIKLSWKVPNNKLLYMLSKADTMGRIADDLPARFDDLELFRELCLENKCFEQRYDFVNDEARVLFFEGRLSSLYYEPFEEYSSQVIMMVGLPGSGKDTWIAANLADYKEVSLDKIRIELGIGPTENQGKVIQRAQEQMKSLLANKEKVVFNATNIIPDIRKKWLRLCRKYKARITIVYIEVPLDVLFKQNSNRDSVVPEDVMWEKVNKLDIPDLTECHKIVYVHDYSERHSRNQNFQQNHLGQNYY